MKTKTKKKLEAWKEYLKKIEEIDEAEK